ncbi:hypothetical protein K2173_014826 [Erythroxylum novogranatense]|uniref:BHLH domain-containing protein n=1 Tax=Erythroxylum novogranatense TaxID=1862640 RepID=A0AAV8TI90_9ROSI|nr:hypothetical protein K2173_014826 [Erythroxylum novogranatense]
MDTASARWFTDLSMDDYQFISQCNISSVDGFIAQNMTTSVGENLHKSLSLDRHSSYPNLKTHIISNPALDVNRNSFGRPSKQQKTSSWNSGITAEQPSTPSSTTIQILSFEAPVSPTNDSQELLRGLGFNLNPKEEALSPGNMNFQPFISKVSYENQNRYDSRNNQASNKRSKSTSMTRNPLLAHDHIMAERKRREKINQRFIALSSIVPGLKKMDKASVLGDAVKYVKQLQERVKELEEQTQKQTVESVVLVRKSQLSADDESSSCDDSNSGGRFNSALPEIEATVSDKDLLIRIHCEKRNSVLAKILNEMENLHVSIVTTSVLPFGNSTLHITIVARMDDEETMTVKDLVRNLRLAVLKFM